MADITQFTADAPSISTATTCPRGSRFGPMVAVDTETMGLNPHRDRLCLVQLSAGDGVAHLVQIVPRRSAAAAPTAPTSSACWPTRRW